MSLHASLSPNRSEPGVQVPIQFAAHDRFESGGSLPCPFLFTSVSRPPLMNVSPSQFHFPTKIRSASYCPLSRVLYPKDASDTAAINPDFATR
jgi:hypothetical protein